MEKIGYAELRKEQAREAAARRADGHRHLQLHRDRRRRPLEALRHPRHQDVRFGRDPHAPDRARRSRGSARSRRARGTRRPTRRSWPRSWASPPRTSQVEEGDTDTAPYGLGTYASRSTPIAGAAGAMAARKIRDKARKIAAHLLEVSEEDLEWEPGKFTREGRAAEGRRRSRRSRSPRTPTTRRAWRPGSRRCPTTIRRTSRSRSGATSAWWTSTRDRRGQGPPVRRRRRLRQHHQSDDRRRADPRRADDGARAGAVRGDPATTRTATSRAAASWTTWCPPRWRRRSGRRTRR